MQLPPVLVALDVLGTVLLAFGIYGKFVADPVLGGIDFARFSLPLIILGAFLMAPLLLHIVRAATSSRR